MNRAVRAATAAFMRSPARHIVGPLITPLDRALFRISAGRLKLSSPMIPSLMLFTTGAKSGLRRESPLMCFPRRDARGVVNTWYIAGSNFGLEHHPAWSSNLMAHPDAQIHFQRTLIAVRARLLTQPEAEVLWPELEVQWPHYRDYEKTAKRDIRIFHLVKR